MKTYSIIYNSASYANAAQSFKQILDELEYRLSENIENSDILIVIDRYQLDTILEKKGHSKKIVLFILKSDISLYWDVDISAIDCIIIGVDTNIKILYPWPNLCHEILPPMPLSVQEYDENFSNNDSIFVNLEEKQYQDWALLKIVRFLNKLTDFKITVVSRTLTKDIFNNNITVIRPVSNLDSYIYSAGIIVGAGYTALKGLSWGKKVIIIGERGYGGIPTINNIALFYNEFFQGSIGGRFDGPIPESLFADDIQKLETRDLRNLNTSVIDLQNESKLKLFNIFRKIISTNNKTINYKFNSDYTIIKSDEDSYWLLNRYTRLVVAQLTPVLATKLLSLYNSGTDSSIFSVEELKSILKYKILITLT